MIFLFAFPGVVAAQDMPRYDVMAYCSRVASVGGTHSATIEKFCVDNEQTEYNKLKAQWGDVPATVQAHCDKVASVGGSSSYTILAYCVTSEIEAAQTKGGFKY